MLEILAIGVLIFFATDLLDKCVKRELKDAKEELKQQITELQEKVDELENNQGGK